MTRAFHLLVTYFQYVVRRRRRSLRRKFGRYRRLVAHAFRQHRVNNLQKHESEFVGTSIHIQLCMLSARLQHCAQMIPEGPSDIASSRICLQAHTPVCSEILTNPRSYELFFCRLHTRCRQSTYLSELAVIQRTKMLRSAASLREIINNSDIGTFVLMPIKDQ